MDGLSPELRALAQQLMYGPVGHYVLDGHTPVRCRDFWQWAQFYDSDARQVADETGAGWRLSTVFLAIGSTHPPGRVPALFETALFADGTLVDVLGRYHTWEQALHGHRVSLGKVPWLLAQTRADQP